MIKNICICICGLNRSLNIVIHNFNEIFKTYNIEFILVISNSIDKEYINNRKNIKDSNVIKKLFLKDYSNNDFRNSQNYSYKIIESIKLIDNKYDVYIICRSDFILNNLDLNLIDKDKIYFSKLNINHFTKNKDRINDNILITKNYKELLKLKELHNFNKKNTNYLDINLFNYVKQNNINCELIDIKYKLILSECNIIAISGDSGSGKTTLSKILSLLFEKETCILETDRYHKWERGNENYKKYTHLNPYANHLERMSEDVFQYKIGEDIYQVDYNHKNGKFTQKNKIQNKNNLILCGLHTLYQKRMNNLLNLKIYLDTDRNLIKKWKIQRDVHERGYDLEKVLKQIKSRENDYKEFILKQKENADIIIQFYEKDNKLECNFIIQNENIYNKLSKNIIDMKYNIIFDNDKYIIILKNNIVNINNNIKFLINKISVNDYYYIEIINFINLICI